MDILGHDGDTFWVNGRQIGVLEETYQVGLPFLLESQVSRAFKAQFGLKILSDF